MRTEYTSLEIQVISCEELRAFNFFQKLSVFVMVSVIAGDDDPKKGVHPALQQRHRTPTSKGGHRNPEWNHDVGFDLSTVSPGDYLGLSVRFDVRLPSVVGSRSIGESRTSLKDLIDDFNGGIEFRRYQVKNDDGKNIGVLNFGYKLCGKSEEVGNELAQIKPSSKAPAPSHDDATNLRYLEWPELPSRTLIRGIVNNQKYSSLLLMQTTNKKDVNKASTGYGYRQSWYSMVGTPDRTCRY